MSPLGGGAWVSPASSLEGVSAFTAGASRRRRGFPPLVLSEHALLLVLLDGVVILLGGHLCKVTGRLAFNRYTASIARVTRLELAPRPFWDFATEVEGALQGAGGAQRDVVPWADDVPFVAEVHTVLQRSLPQQPRVRSRGSRTAPTCPRRLLHPNIPNRARTPLQAGL